MNSPVFTINVGNTNVSLARVETRDGTRAISDGVVVRLGAWPTRAVRDDDPAVRSAFLAALMGVPDAPVHVGCVVAPAAPVLARWISEAGLTGRFLTHAELPLRVDVPAPERVGIDRLLNCAAAWRRFGRACLVVDLGTAVTYDLVVPPGVFLGGVIAPGLETLSFALSACTALPHVPPEPTDVVLGRDTPACLRAGLWFGFLGQLEALVARLLEDGRLHATLPAPPLTLLTGGAAPLVSPYLKFSHQVLPDLTQEGLALA
jgi:pantothenate kinase type III